MLFSRKKDNYKTYQKRINNINVSHKDWVFFTTVKIRYLTSFIKNNDIKSLRSFEFADGDKVLFIAMLIINKRTDLLEYFPDFTSDERIIYSKIYRINLKDLAIHYGVGDILPNFKPNRVDSLGLPFRNRSIKDDKINSEWLEEYEECFFYKDLPKPKVLSKKKQ